MVKAPSFTILGPSCLILSGLSLGYLYYQSRHAFKHHSMNFFSLSMHLFLVTAMIVRMCFFLTAPSILPVEQNSKLVGAIWTYP